MKTKSSRTRGANAAAWFYSTAGFGSSSLGYASAEVIPASPEFRAARLLAAIARAHTHLSGHYSAACVLCRLEGK